MTNHEAAEHLSRMLDDVCTIPIPSSNPDALADAERLADALRTAIDALLYPKTNFLKGNSDESSRSL